MLRGFMLLRPLLTGTRLGGGGLRQLATTTNANPELTGWRAGIDVAGWTHMNAAGASPTSQECHDAVQAHLDLERAVGGYAAAAQRPHNAKEALAALLNADADEVALCESAQRAWNLAFGSLDLKSGDRIICFASEYAGNAVAFLQAAKRTGCRLDVLPMRDDGVIDVEALRSALAATGGSGGGAATRTVVCLTHIQTGESIVQPAAEVGALAKAAGALYLIDACQSVGAMPVDVRALRCDFACGTGRKWLRGPRGTGFLYARRGALAAPAEGGHPLVGEPSALDHTSARWTAEREYELAPGAARYEFWECSVASAAGLAVAAKQCAAVDPARIAERSRALARRLRAGLAAVTGIVPRDAPPAFDEAAAAALGAARCAIVTFEAESTRGVGARDVVAALAARRIGASASPPTHTFEEALWARPLSVRLSPSYFNTEAEVDAVVAAVRDVLDELEAAPPSAEGGAAGAQPRQRGC